MKNIFRKKNPVKKLDIKFDERPEQKININIKPLVKIEKHESRVNGKVQAPEFRISIGGRDIVMLNSREYNELFSEMLYRMDDSEIMHALYEAHDLKHKEAFIASESLGRMFHKIIGGDKDEIDEILAKMNKSAEDAHNS